MTWKNIETSREIRAWGKIIGKALIGAAVVAIAFRDEIKEAGHSLKKKVKKIFSKNSKTIEVEPEKDAQ